MYLAQYLMGTDWPGKDNTAGYRALRAAIELQPDSAWAHYQMGSACSRVVTIRRRSFISRLRPIACLILAKPVRSWQRLMTTGPIRKTTKPIGVTGEN